MERKKQRAAKMLSLGHGLSEHKLYRVVRHFYPTDPFYFNEIVEQRVKELHNGPMNPLQGRDAIIK